MHEARLAREFLEALSTKVKTRIVSSLTVAQFIAGITVSTWTATATYYDLLKRDNKPDKYAKVKAFIKELYYREHETYGYRRIHDEAVKRGFPYAEETIRRLMSYMGLKVSIYSKHTAQYHAYKGKVGGHRPQLS